MRSEIIERRFDDIPLGVLEPFRGKRVVVTGATGLVGSLVCRVLLLANERHGLGCGVVAVVRNPSKAERLLEGYAHGADLQLLVADFSEGAEIRVSGDVDFILHTAAITSSRIMVERPADVIEVSVSSTESMLALAREKGARMVFVSSMEAYGTLAQGEVASEGSLGWIDLEAPRSCYPESKRLCECLCNAAAHQHGVEVCSARLAQTFGAGVLPGENRAFAQFARSAMRGEDVVLRTRGLSEGNYVNSADCVCGLLLLLANGESGRAYNVADERSHRTIRQVAELAVSLLGTGSSKVVVDVDEGNAAGYAPDVHLRLSSERLRGLGWEPRVPLEGSFLELAAYMREQGMV